MTIQWRLSLWYMCVTLAILVIFSMATYLGMRHLLYSALDKERDLISQAIESSYDPYQNVFKEMQIDPFRLSRNLKQTYIVVYDSFERPIFHSPLAEQIEMPIPLTRQVIEERHTIRMTDGAGGQTSIKYHSTTYRTFSRKIVYRNKTIGWVNMAFPTTEIESSMHNLLKSLMLGILLAVGLIGSGSYFLTRKALRPVAIITNKAREISSRNLSERLDVYNEHDELGGLTVVLNDLLQRLENSFLAQRRFMADAAHELKTPLAVLRAHWEDEINNDGISQEVREKLVQDTEIISRLAHLINNMLLLAQTEETKFERKRLQLDAVVKDVIYDVQVLADMKSQQLHLHVTPTSEVTGDRDRLYQLVFNLVENAIKYTPEKGTIWVHLERRENQTRLSIEDDGPGIAEEHLPCLFERFYRVKKDRSRKTGGSGLGLAICKLIVEAHHGTIEVTSQPNAGTRFQVRLPLATDVA